jgi:molybdopterin-guanine dinucleotide biosynthesis protein A
MKNFGQAFILAGGASSRMGTDKSRLLLSGRTFVEQIARELLQVAESVTLVGRQSDKDELKLPSTYDLHEHWGALGGLHAALSACHSEWAAVVACDLPFITAALFSRLASLAEGFDAVAPIQKDGIPQPLCALYRVASCLSRAEILIQSGERKPIALLQSVNTRWVEFAELADLVAANHLFDNVNTPQDYALASEKDEVAEPRVKI